jgi:four helix bundle protein
MGNLNQFEDLEIWQKAREVCNDVFIIRESTNLKKDFKLYEQINASSGSTMDNIAEGFERNGNREFLQFLSIAKASCGETRSQLYRILDRNYITQEEFEVYFLKLITLSKQIGSFMNYLQKSEYKGSKYKDKP